MSPLERNAARDALTAAVCAACRPVIKQWFINADGVDLDKRLCPRCLCAVDRMLSDLMRHYERA